MQAAEMGKVERGACLRLLDQGVIGRVVYTEAAWPAVQPVSYLLDGQEVIFRAGEGSKLAAATRCAVVAFQVDQIDSRTDTGWSVLGVVWLMKYRLESIGPSSPTGYRFFGLRIVRRTSWLFRCNNSPGVTSWRGNNAVNLPRTATKEFCLRQPESARHLLPC
jgi:hypothetical protein